MQEPHINLGRAACDLVYLLERGYPRKSSIELVGNRYRLSGDCRKILFRGVFGREECESRTAKRTGAYPSGPLLCVVDCYNVLITIESYLTGRCVFRALDGFTRDIAGVYGNYSFGRRTEQAIVLLLDCLRDAGQGQWEFQFYLDAPVSRSADMACFLRDALERADIIPQVEVVRSPDRRIITAHAHDLVATSDTVLIDCVGHCIDLPALVLERRRSRDFLDLQQLTEELIPWVGALI
jgi:hypothetical protein